MLSAQKTRINKGYGKATYMGINQGKNLNNWLVAGPFMLDSTMGRGLDVQEKFFDEDLVTNISSVEGKPVKPLQIKGKNFNWQSYTSKNDMIDFDSAFNKADYAAAYALSEIWADSSFNALIGLGSDDGVKVWLNGTPVHSNWVPRGIVADDDIIPVRLEKGSNQLLIKVQDMQGGWGFTARFLDKAALSKRLVAAAAGGKVDDINLLLNAGAGLNARDEAGLSAVNAARLRGREEIVQLLLQKGAADEPLPAPELLIDGLYKSLEGKPHPGIAVLISRDGNIIYKKGFGYADIEKKELVRPDTKFRIGSITKQFIAAGILKLQEEGKLSLADRLSKYVPGFPRGEEISLHHLLTHTSGIHSYTNNDDFVAKVVSPVKSEELISNIQKDSFDFNPGEQYRYNNSGYFLLGHIIEKVSGKSTYSDYLKEAFFDPLQMNNTGVYSSNLNLSNEARGYTKNNNKFERAINWDMSWAGGAGALYSTVEDLFKWDEAVFGGKVLNDSSLTSAFTPVVLNSGKKPTGVEYGYGWGIGNYRGMKAIAHSGGLHGFLSQNTRFTDKNLNVILLTNVTPAEEMIDPNTIAEYYLSGEMEKQASYSVQAGAVADLKIYEGRYDFQNSAVMSITSDGKNLFAQLSGQGKYPIFPSLPDEFFWKVVEARIKFIKDEKGNVTSAQFFQNGGEINVPKLKDEVIAKVDPVIFKDYVGDYDYGSNMIIHITSENDKLFAMATGEQKYEIFPLSDTTFLVKELNAKITFLQEAGAAAGKIMVEIGGQKKQAPRVKK